MNYSISVTRLGDLLDFGQLFKAFGNNLICPNPTFLGNLCKGVKIFYFSSEIIFGQLKSTFANFLLVTLYSIETKLNRRVHFEDEFVTQLFAAALTGVCQLKRVTLK